MLLTSLSSFSPLLAKRSRHPTARDAVEEGYVLSWLGEQGPQNLEICLPKARNAAHKVFASTSGMIGRCPDQLLLASWPGYSGAASRMRTRHNAFWPISNTSARLQLWRKRSNSLNSGPQLGSKLLLASHYVGARLISVFLLFLFWCLFVPLLHVFLSFPMGNHPL